MSNRLPRDISNFLAANPKYRSWEKLPDEFLRRSADLSAEAVVEAALELWKSRHHRSMFASTTLLQRHPTAFGRVRWRVLEEMGDQMDNWGAVDAFALLAGKAWRDRQISDARVHRWARSKNRDDMVVKGMSWALRELIATDRGAVERFLEEHEDGLAARVKREVRNKLTTGLKNPHRKASPLRRPR